MSRTPRPRPRGCLSRGVFVLVAVAVAAPAAAAREQDPLISPGAASSEIRLPSPARYAIVGQAPGPVRRLYGRGDIVFHPQDPTRAWSVERVDPGTLVLRDGPRGPVQALSVGRPIPGFPGWLFTGTVLLEQLYYRYRIVERIAHPDPVLVAVEGSRAILEVEVPRPRAPLAAAPAEVPAPPAPEPSLPPRALLDPEVLRKVQVQEVGPGLYEVAAADVYAVLDNAGGVLADLAPHVLPSLTFETGLQYRISSAAGDGILTGQGFTVIAPKLAERAGIRVGDTVLSVNGRPVDGFASLYRIFREVRRTPGLRTIQVELDRGGTRLTKTYRIR